MVIITDMENGERVFVQGEKQDVTPTRLAEAGWVCPELQSFPPTVDEPKVMPALMEHPFVTHANIPLAATCMPSCP